MRDETIDMAGRVHKLLTEKGLTISVAESCTGGLLSHLLTMLPGSSSFFETGIVAYSGRSKEEILGISGTLIARYGVVSEQISMEMAERVRVLAGTDFSISTTGNLGPGALEDKGVGLIYISVSGRNGTVSRELRLSGGRDENKETAALRSLELLLEVINKA